MCNCGEIKKYNYFHHVYLPISILLTLIAAAVFISCYFFNSNYCNFINNNKVAFISGSAGFIVLLIGAGIIIRRQQQKIQAVHTQHINDTLPQEQTEVQSQEDSQKVEKLTEQQHSLQLQLQEAQQRNETLRLENSHLATEKHETTQQLVEIREQLQALQEEAQVTREANQTLHSENSQLATQKHTTTQQLAQLTEQLQALQAQIEQTNVVKASANDAQAKSEEAPSAKAQPIDPPKIIWNKIAANENPNNFFKVFKVTTKEQEKALFNAVNTTESSFLIYEKENIFYLVIYESNSYGRKAQVRSLRANPLYPNNVPVKAIYNIINIGGRIDHQFVPQEEDSSFFPRFGFCKVTNWDLVNAKYVEKNCFRCLAPYQKDWLQYLLLNRKNSFVIIKDNDEEDSYEMIENSASFWENSKLTNKKMTLENLIIFLKTTDKHLLYP